MWEEIGKWLVLHHGTTGVIVVGETAAIGTLASAVAWLFKRYAALQAENMRASGAQAASCRMCLAETDSRHAAAIEDYYKTMRTENAEQWRHMEALLDRSTTATTAVAGKLGELSGKLDVIGRRA
jgi:hypothetical protein